MNNLHYGILYRRRPRQYRLRPDILQDPTYSDEEIRQRFRFSRRGIRFIHDLVEVDLTRETQRNHALSAMTQVQSSLRFFASNSVYIVNGDVIGVDKSSVSRVNKAFCRSIVRRGRRFLKFPTTQAEKDEVKKGFYELGGMPSTIGCIDGTHIKIIAPKDNEVDFVNRKGTHSINVQAITDHRYLFLDVDARWPGSAHDSFIFRMSAVKAHLDATHRNVQDGIIIGDSGYTLSEQGFGVFDGPIRCSTNKTRTALQQSPQNHAILCRAFLWSLQKTLSCVSRRYSVLPRNRLFVHCSWSYCTTLIHTA